MSGWIIRFPKHKPTIGGPRPVVVLHVIAEGEETELETLQFWPVDQSLAALVSDEIDNGRVRLILDLAEIDQIDATSIGQIAAAHCGAMKLGVSLVLANLNPKLREVFHFTNLDSAIPIFDSIPEALGHFAS